MGRLVQPPAVDIQRLVKVLRKDHSVDPIPFGMREREHAKRTGSARGDSAGSDDSSPTNSKGLGLSQSQRLRRMRETEAAKRDAKNDPDGFDQREYTYFLDESLLLYRTEEVFPFLLRMVKF